jgi:hypothetical protein
MDKWELQKLILAILHGLSYYQTWFEKLHLV